HEGVQQTARAVRAEHIPLLHEFVPEVPPALESVVMRALERDRTKRYSTARALQADLEAALAPQGGVPSSAALSEFMSSLFGATLEQRVFVDESMTAVIPMTKAGVTLAPTVFDSPPGGKREPSSVSRPRWRRWAMLGGAVSVVALFVALGYRAKRRVTY